MLTLSYDHAITAGTAVLHGRPLLLCPGPVVVAPTVRHIFGSVETGHRTPEALEHLRAARENLIRVYDLYGYEAIVLAGSGTSAMESILASAMPSDGRLLIVTNGRFGDRLSHIAASQRIAFDLIDFGWNEKIVLDRVEAALESNVRYTHLAFVHHETSTGRLNPLHGLVMIAQSHGVDTIVDMVSSFGGELLESSVAPTWIATSANKCIESYPGVGIVIGRKERFAALHQHVRGFTQNLRLHYEAQCLRGQPLVTPPVQVVAALAEASSRLVQEDVATRNERYRRRSGDLRKELAAFDLRPAVARHEASAAVTVYRLPELYRARQVLDGLLTFGIVAYAADKQNGNAITLSTMGQLSDVDLRHVVRSVGTVLALIRQHEPFAR